MVVGNKLDLSTTHQEVHIEDVTEWLYCTLPKMRQEIVPKAWS